MSCLNLEEWLRLSSSRFDHIDTLLQYLLRAPQKILFKLAVLVYKCLHGTAPSYLADELELILRPGVVFDQLCC